MDGSRFDELTRLLAGSVSRRTALKAAVGALIPRSLPSRAFAAQGTCDIFANCAPDGGNRCIVLQDVDGACMCAFRPMAKSVDCSREPVCTSDDECEEGAYCAVGWCSDGLGRCHGGCEGQGGVGKCAAGLTVCSAQCVDLSSDRLHCGTCTTQCMGETGPGYTSGGICVEGQCQLISRDDADHCGDECTDFRVAWSHCGACGNQCGTGQICCEGRCVSETDAERFCDFCGQIAGWTQGCLPEEMCDRGLCVQQDGSRTFSQAVVVVRCPTVPQIEHHYDTSDAEVYLDSWETYGCAPVDGGTIEAYAPDGRLVSTCDIEEGICLVSGTYGDLPLELVRPDTPPNELLQLDWGNTLDTSNVGWRMALVYVEAGSAHEPTTVSDSDASQPTGDLAYAVKNGDHWDIWVYNFDTEQNTQLTSEPNSDQWAPAYSHDGTRLAYLSDQTDGSNQVWLMDPDGGNQRQISFWQSSESIQNVAWSPDDSQLVVTLFETDRRLAIMPATGGELASLVAPSSSFASIAPSGATLYTVNQGAQTSFSFGYFQDLSNAAFFAEGDAPNISMDGRYGAVQVGDPGSRSILTYGLVMDSPPLPIVPRLGDASNPVWLSTANDALAFVSNDIEGETIQVCRLGESATTSIEIAPHDRVWYLSKRLTGEPSVPSTTQQAESIETLPTLEPLPDETGAEAVSGTNGLAGRVEFRALTCTGAETEFSVNGPVMALDYGPPCSPMAVPQRMNIQGDNGYRTVIMAPATLDLQMGRYTVTHVVSGVTRTFDLVPTDAFIQSCSGNPDCLYQWFVTFITDVGANSQETDGSQTQPTGSGSLEVHLVDCPPEFSGPDYYGVCHDNGIGQMEFILESESVYEEASAVVEQSPGPGIARFWDLAPGTYGLDLRTKFVKAPAYVFCSPDQGETVLVDQVLADYHDPVLVPVNGQAVVCDWNMLH